MATTLHAFDGRTGAHLCRLDATTASWSQEINEGGRMTATVLRPPERALLPWATALAVVEDGGSVRFAGYMTHARLDRDAGTWSLDCGGGEAILEKRLVMSHALDASWRDGQVLVDEDNPAGDWPLKLTGSYSDIISRLIRETERWGELPIVPAPLTGGGRERNYNSYDLATVLQRIEDIGGLEDGPEWRLDPELDPSTWKLAWRQRTSADGGELVDSSWRWNALVPASGVVLGDEDAEGEGMCCHSYLTGGRDEDRLLVARSKGRSLTSAGWPLLQVADTSHSTVSVLSTLQAHARALMAAGDEADRTVGLRVDGTRYGVRVGDHANVRYGEGTDDVLSLKVVGVSGSMASGMLTLSCRERS